MKIEEKIVTDIGLVRKANEDYVGRAFSADLNNNGEIFIVCDGMGGHVGGAIASKSATEFIIEYFKQSFYENPYIAISNAIVFANEQIFARSRAEEDLRGMGTTCTVLLIRDNEAFIGHVGDSRIYLVSDNKLNRISKDHSFVQGLVDSGVIADEDAEKHPRKNELTRALGIKAIVEPEVYSKPILAKNGDLFMLCSDGLCGLVNDATIESVLVNDQNLVEKTQELILLAKNAGGTDNISVGLVKIIESPHTQSDFPKFAPPVLAQPIVNATNEKTTSKVHVKAEPESKMKKLIILLGAAIIVGFGLWYMFFREGTPIDPEIAETDSIPSDSTDNNEMVEDILVIENECDYVFVFMQGDNLGNALDTLKAKAGDDYFRKCLRLQLKNELIEGKKIRNKRKKFGKKIQPNDSLWLDCNCIINQRKISQNDSELTPLGETNTDQNNTPVPQNEVDNNATEPDPNTESTDDTNVVIPPEVEIEEETPDLSPTDNTDDIEEKEDSLKTGTQNN